MQLRFNEHLKAIGGEGKNILLAVSGGVDSVVLLNLLTAAGIRPAIAHVNFQLRGIASDEDEAFVKHLADGNNLPVFIQRFHTKNYAEEHGISTQMAARDLRYQWFNELLTEHSFDYIATAHHLNDSVETLLNNLVRGTGIKGLTGIAAINGNIIRPLLPFLRTEILSHANGQQLQWREDSSNASIDYQRNFIRHEIIPKLQTLNPSLEETVARTMRRLAGIEELADIALASLKEKYVTRHGAHIHISKSLFDQLTNHAAILFELVREFGFNLSQCVLVIEGMDGQAGKLLQSSDHTLLIDRTSFIISPLRGRYESVEIMNEDSASRLGSTQLSLERLSGASILDDRDSATLDLATLSFPLVWRLWRDGDEFYPLGMQHRKKVSDFLIDNKIPLNKKAEVTVIESEGKIAWIVGYRIDDRFKVTSKTNSALRLRVIQNA